MPRRSPSDPPAECFEGIDAWAAEVAAAVDEDELDQLIGIHKKIAGNTRISAGNRQLSEAKVKALTSARRKKKPAKNRGQK